MYNVYNPHPQEFLVKAADRIELMAMLGAFGAIISACQMYPFYMFYVEKGRYKDLNLLCMEN